MMRTDIKEEFFRLRDEIIEKDFEHLDEEQLEAVLTSERNVLVLACPGSGKTTVLINRLKYLVKYGQIYKSEYIPLDLSEDDLVLMRNYIKDYRAKLPNGGRLIEILGKNRVSPGNIIVITFTKAAAANMKKRFEKLKCSSGMPFFGTFHGLFYKILMRYNSSINIIQSSEEYRIISHTLSSHVDEVSEEQVKDIRNKISLLKTSNIDLDKLDLKLDKKIFEECFKAYEAFKADRGLLDFDDLQIMFKQLLGSSPKILEMYRKGFKYMLIDEFQDCDFNQLEILKLLNNDNSIFSVGDEDQAIYSFRGSRPDYMVEFNTHFYEGIKLQLSTNYRSSENIVNAASNLIKNNKIRNDKAMNSFRKDTKKIEVIKFNDETSQGEDIAAALQKLKALGGYDHNESAILFRTNMESRGVIDAFIRKKLPFRLMEKEYNFFEHFICKDILAYLRLSIIPEDYESFKRIINKPFRYISKINIEKLRNSNIRGNFFELMKDMEEIPVFQMKKLDELQRNIYSLNRMTLQGAIHNVVTTLGYNEFIKEYSTKFKIAVSELEDIIEEFKEAAKPFNTIVALLSHVEKTKEEIKSSRSSTEEGVILSTIHGVKGMEFKNVFIINCSEGFIPHSSNMENIEEERRLFFVGITRAIDNLFICSPRNIRNKYREPSRFIDECNLSSHNSMESMYAAGDEIIHNSFGRGKIISIEKNVVSISFHDKQERKFDSSMLYNRGLIKKVEPEE